MKTLEWTDEITEETRLGKAVIYTMIGGLFTYYGSCWLSYAFRVLINYREIRDEAPLNIIKLG